MSEDLLSTYYPEYDYSFEAPASSFDVGRSDIFLDGISVPPSDDCLFCSLTGNNLHTYYLSPDFAVFLCPVCDIPVLVSRIHSLNFIPSFSFKAESIVSNLFPSFISFYKKSFYNHLSWHIITNPDDQSRIDEQHKVFLVG